jgi:hypothetical protein
LVSDHYIEFMRKLLTTLFLIVFTLSLFGQGVKQSGWTTTTNPITARAALSVPSFAQFDTNTMKTNGSSVGVDTNKLLAMTGTGSTTAGGVLSGQTTNAVFSTAGTNAITAMGTGSTTAGGVLSGQTTNAVFSTAGTNAITAMVGKSFTNAVAATLSGAVNGIYTADQGEYQVTNWSGFLTNGAITVNRNSGTITPVSAGVYLLSADVTLRPGGGAWTAQMAGLEIRTNGVMYGAEAASVYQPYNTIGDVHLAIAPIAVNLPAGCAVSMWVYGLDIEWNYSLPEANLTVVSLATAGPQGATGPAGTNGVNGTNGTNTNALNASQSNVVASAIINSSGTNITVPPDTAATLHQSNVVSTAANNIFPGTNTFTGVITSNLQIGGLTINVPTNTILLSGNSDTNLGFFLPVSATLLTNSLQQSFVLYNAGLWYVMDSFGRTHYSRGTNFVGTWNIGAYGIGPAPVSALVPVINGAVVIGGNSNVLFNGISGVNANLSGLFSGQAIIFNTPPSLGAGSVPYIGSGGLVFGATTGAGQVTVGTPFTGGGLMATNAGGNLLFHFKGTTGDLFIHGNLILGSTDGLNGTRAGNAMFADTNTLLIAGTGGQYDAGGLTNLQSTNLVGTVPMSNLPSVVITNGQPGVAVITVSNASTAGMASTAGTATNAPDGSALVSSNYLTTNLWTASAYAAYLLTNGVVAQANAVNPTNFAAQLAVGTLPLHNYFTSLSVPNTNGMGIMNLTFPHGLTSAPTIFGAYVSCVHNDASSGITTNTTKIPSGNFWVVVSGNMKEPAFGVAADNTNIIVNMTSFSAANYITVLWNGVWVGITNPTNFVLNPYYSNF